MQERLLEYAIKLVITAAILSLFLWKSNYNFNIATNHAAELCIDDVKIEMTSSIITKSITLTCTIPKEHWLGEHEHDGS